MSAQRLTATLVFAGLYWAMILVLFVLFVRPAAASGLPYSCAQIRAAASQYGVSNLVWYARQNGYSERQIRQAMACLRPLRSR